MANTTNFGWETPDDTDLVKDGAAAMRTLGNAIDASFVDLKGGTTGQILSKTSNTDMDFTWIANDVGDITEVVAGTGMSGGGSSGSVTLTNTVATEFDAKGDLIVGTGSDTFDRLAVGTNGYTLVADSAETTGLKWAAPAGASLVGCKVTKAVDTPQTIANNTGTVVTWTVESFDTDGFHSNDTNTGRLTIPSGKGGKYLINANIWWQGNSTGIRMHEILLNGGSYARANFPATSTENFGCSLTTIGTFTAGDYLELYVKQNTGGNLSFSDLYTSFSCIYLGA